MRYLYILLFVTLTVGCSQSDPRPESSYADYVNVGGRHYINAWELALVYTDGVIEFGEVERGSVIPEGTPVYVIPGYSEQDVIAVKTDGNYAGMVTNISGYLIYVQHGENGKSHYPKVEDQQVKQIKIFRGSELLRELNGEDVNSFLLLFNQQGPHNEFQSEKGPIYTVMLISDNALGFNYGVKEKDGHFGLSHIESKLPDPIADYFK